MYDMNNMKKLKKFGDLAPAAWQGFLAFDKAAMADGAIPAKTKECWPSRWPCPPNARTASKSTPNGPRRPAAPRRKSRRRCWSRQLCAPAPRLPTALMLSLNMHFCLRDSPSPSFVARQRRTHP